MRILHVGDDFAALRPCGLTLYSEALMQAQAAAGHQVAYVFSGRCYPVVRTARLRRWEQGGVRMFELVNAPSASHWETGTREPLRDLDEAAGEAAVATALATVRPDVVHVHELSRLPSSVIGLARTAGAVVLATLHDYRPVCAAVRLLDADGVPCTRHDVGVDCARNCAGAPGDRSHLVRMTLAYERRRVPGLRALRRPSRRGAAQPSAGAPAPPEEYQRRRDVNLSRLNICDRLVAPSARVAEIYAGLGVEPRRLVVQRLSLPHLEGLRPGIDRPAAQPLRFVALGTAASRAKGAGILVEAFERLHEDGIPFSLRVLGHVDAAIADRLAALKQVELHGAYALHELDALLEDGDVGLMVSTWEEAHGFAGIEMLARGLPLVATALGGLPEYVRADETGWLCPRADAAGLADTLARLVADPAGVDRVRVRVRARRSQIVRPWADHVGEVATLYDELLDQRAAMSSPTARRSGS